MSKEVIKNLLFISFMFINSFSFSQITKCTNDKFNELEYIKSVEISKKTINNRSSVQLNVPIHFFVIVNDYNVPNGDPNLYSNSSINTLINNINSYYNGSNISFYHCKTTFVKSPTLFDLSLGYDSNGYPTELNQLLTGDNLDPNSLCIYVVNSFQDVNPAPGAKGTYPTNIPGELIFPNTSSNWKHPNETNNYVLTTEMNATILSHEIGHYLNVVHIDNISTNLSLLYDVINGGPFWQLGLARPFVNDVTVNGVEYTSSNSGDFLPTNADPGKSLCPSTNCDDLCPISTKDPYDNIYSPDFKNIMRSDINSGNICSPKHFHQSQFDLMYSTLTNDPYRTNIINVNSSCNILPDYGYGTKGCNDGNSPKKLNGHTIEIFDSHTNRTTTSSFVGPLGAYNLYSHSLSANYGQANVKVISKTNDWLEGVNAFDLVAMLKHILFVAQFTDPYQYLAADLNYSGHISTADMVELRKLLLNISYPNANNWRFVPNYYFDPLFNFSNSFNSSPFSAVWNNQFSYLKNSSGLSYMDTYRISLDDALAKKESSWNWMATKTGDVNCSANPTLLQNNEIEEKILTRNINRCYNTNEEVKFKIRAKVPSDVLVWQMGFSLDPDIIELINIENGTNSNPNLFNLDNFGTTKWQDGEFRALWIDDLLSKINLSTEKELFQLKIKIKQPVCNFSEVFKLNSKVMPTMFLDDSTEIKNVEIKLQIEDNQTQMNNIPVNVYPNPFSDQITLEFKLLKSTNVKIELFDNAGHLLKSHKNYFNKGENSVNFDGLKGINQGMIYYKITTDYENSNGTILNIN